MKLVSVFVHFRNLIVNALILGPQKLGGLLMLVHYSLQRSSLLPLHFFDRHNKIIIRLVRCNKLSFQLVDLAMQVALNRELSFKGINFAPQTFDFNFVFVNPNLNLFRVPSSFCRLGGSVRTARAEALIVVDNLLGNGRLRLAPSAT